VATRIEILERRVERIENLLESVLPRVPLEMASFQGTVKFIEDFNRDKRERPTPEQPIRPERL